jgi:hypothetical protein
MSDSNLILPKRTEAQARRDIAYEAMLMALKPFADIGIATYPEFKVTISKSDVECARAALALAERAR